MTGTGSRDQHEPRARLKLSVDATALLLPRTGIGLFTAEMLQALSMRGDVRVSAFNASWRGRGRGWLPSDVSNGSNLSDGTDTGDVGDGVVEVPGRLMTGRVRLLWEYLALPRLEWFAGAADVVHGPNYRVPPTARAAAVMSVHDVSFERAGSGSAPAAALRRSVRTAIRRGAWVHADSDYVAEEIRATYRIDPQRVVTVPLGVRLPSAGAHPAPGAPYLLSLGSSEQRKDLTTLVAAFDAIAAQDRDLRLIFAGPDGNAAQALAEAVSRSPHCERILQLGWIDDSSRAALIRHAAAVAYPSLYEGFGLVPLEAMLAGRPVVTTPVSAIPEVAGDAVLYAAPGDADELADALRQVLTDSELVASLAERGRARAATFTWERTAEGLMNLYRQAVTSRH